MATNEDNFGTRRLSFSQRAWCAMMGFVIVASATAFGLFIEDKLYPESGPVIRMELAELTPQPGFDI